MQILIFCTFVQIIKVDIKDMQTSGASFNAEELKARFNPEGSPLRRQQLLMLEMVKELDRVCRKYSIPYFLYGGTLLGVTS